LFSTQNNKSIFFAGLLDKLRVELLPIH